MVKRCDCQRVLQKGSQSRRKKKAVCPPIHVVILAGGAGARLWPLSHSNQAKPFLRLPFDQTLILQTWMRACHLTPSSNVWVVTVASQVGQVRQALPSIGKDRIIVEPEGRNTAAAVTLATLRIEAVEGDHVTLLVMPADAYIQETDIFSRQVSKGIDRAGMGKSIVTFGLPVAAPRTDYGYIEIHSKSGSRKIFPVKRFIEKPSQGRVRRFMKSACFFWNSGMFAWRSDFFRQEMREHGSEFLSPLVEMKWKSRDTAKTLRDRYRLIPKTSIDYALMEKSRFVEVIPVDFSWSDLGTWDALWALRQTKRQSNIILNQGQVFDGERNLVYAKDRSVVLYGVNDLVVIQTEAQTLVTTREKSKELKTLVQELGE